jgi:hypothetical protein
VSKTFRESLPAKEREILQEFDSPNAMIQELEKHCQLFQKKRKLSAICRKVERFSTAWAPFFQIVNAFVGPSSGLAPLAWGAIRLVFLVSDLFR